MNDLIERITRCPGEPHPDDEHAWKAFWAIRYFKPEQPLYRSDLEWLHQCWNNTKALWHTLK